MHVRTYIRIILNDLLQDQQQVDDILRDHISRCSLGAEDKIQRSCRLFALLDLQILVDDIEGIHLLTLVLMHTLDLYIKNAVLSQFDLFLLGNISGQLLLSVLLDLL